MNLTENKLKEVVATYVDSNKIALDTFQETRENVVGLLDKIGKITTINYDYKDKLEILDGEILSYGKTIEEYFIDLCLPEESGATPGTNDGEALKYFSATARPVAYSYTLGKKLFARSIPYNNIERAVHFADQYQEIVNDLSKKLFASETVFKYAAKRQMLATLSAKNDDALDNATAFATNTAFKEGTYVKSSENDVAIVMSDIESTNTSTFDELVTSGSLIVLETRVTMEIPTDTTTGEEFIKQIKKDVEKACDINEGNSLNGATIGSSSKYLYLFVKQGIMPSLEVDTESGAYHLDKLAIPAKTVVIKDFGDDATGIFAMLVDIRGIKLHNTYRAVRDELNARNDFITYFLHTEYTAYLSRNTYFKVYKEA